MTYIWIDDVRNPTIPNATWCRSYESAIAAINSNCEDSIILCLDHDLGGEKTGYDICKYIIENSVPISLIQIHSANPVGRSNMNQLLTRYGYNVVMV